MNCFNFVFICFVSFLNSQTLLLPDRVFDGNEIHENWVVLVEGDRILLVGEESLLNIPSKTTRIELSGTTLMPGIIEGHSHILLHPYNETSWDDQVLKESYVERSIRAVNHLRESLISGVTTMRDLGSEGAGYSDVYIKQAIEKGLIDGPRLLVAGPAIVATGAYGPKEFHEGVTVPLGAEEASGNEVIATVRRQLGGGADFIKIYADYRWSKGEESQPTFSLEELKNMVETAESAGRYAVAHASTEEGMKRAISAGVETIEHGNGGTKEIFKMMKEKNVALCPTLAALDAISQYKGWNKKTDPEPTGIIQKRESFKAALESGVTIAFGGDVGVFPHGENYRELELLVDYGMSELDALKSATSINANVFHLENLGEVKANYIADLIAVQGNPVKDISNMSQVKFVMKGGTIFKNEN